MRKAFSKLKPKNQMGHHSNRLTFQSYGKHLAPNWSDQRAWNVPAVSHHAVVLCQTHWFSWMDFGMSASSALFWLKSAYPILECFLQPNWCHRHWPAPIYNFPLHSATDACRSMSPKNAPKREFKLLLNEFWISISSKVERERNALL